MNQNSPSPVTTPNTDTNRALPRVEPRPAFPVAPVGPGRRSLAVVLTLTAALLTLCQTGCLTKSRPPKQLFALSAPVTGVPTPVTSLVLQLKEVRVNPLFNDKALVYRVGDHSYESDPYAAFMVAPDRMLEETIRLQLWNTGLFLDVVGNDTPLEPNLTAEVDVVAFYGDFRGNDSGEAVFSARFLFYQRGRQGPPRVVYAQDFVKRSALSERTPAALLEGWDQALTELIHQLAGELRPIAVALPR